MPTGELEVEHETHVIYQDEHPENRLVPKLPFFGVCLGIWDCETGECLLEEHDRPTEVSDGHKEMLTLTMPGYWMVPTNAWLANKELIKFDVKFSGKPKKVYKRRGSVLLCLPQTVIDSTGKLGDWNNDGEMVYMLDLDQ